MWVMLKKQVQVTKFSELEDRHTWWSSRMQIDGTGLCLRLGIVVVQDGLWDGR